MPIIIDGTGTISGVSANGGISSPQTGSVIQVVQGTYASQVTTNSVSYVTTNLTATITPKFSTSKIIVMTSANIRITNGSWFGLRVYRNGSSEYQPASGINYNNTTGAGAVFSWPCAFNYVSNPASTSAQTYTLYMNNAVGGANLTTFNPDVSDQYIILMEIAG
jgi:hypothetical protein